MIYSPTDIHEEAKLILKQFRLIIGPAEDSALATCKVLLCWPSAIDRRLLSKLTSLVAIQTISAGVDDLDFSQIPPGVKVFSNAGAYTGPAAEHAWGLLLAAAKGIGVVKKVEPYLLRGKTLLVLGCGSIGSEVGRIGKAAFSMKTVGVSRSFKVPDVFDIRMPISSLDEAISNADFIVNTLPLNVHTLSILNYRNLSRAKRNVVIVNVGRAETVDFDSIFRILKERPETRFATDVFWRKEGKEDFESPLWGMQNFTGSFHTAGGLGSEEALRDAEVRAAENVRLFLTTGKAENEVDFADYLGLRNPRAPS